MRNRTCDVGLDQRCRDLDGEIGQKRGDTLVRTLRQTYGPDFAPGFRSAIRLGTLPRADMQITSWSDQEK